MRGIVIIFHQIYSWIGVDNFRSSIRWTQGSTLSREISRSVGFTGNIYIGRFRGGITTSRNITQTATIHAQAVIDPWTTANWRPYIAREVHHYSGVSAQVRIIIPDTRNVTVTAEYAVLRVQSTEVWTRVNTLRNINASTPLPPTTAPPVRW